MRDIVYTTDQFEWKKDDNCFYGEGVSLWEQSGYFHYPFPNGRKQFFIQNPKTKGFRRFRFVREFIENEVKEIYEYKTEDGIRCRIVNGILG